MLKRKDYLRANAMLDRIKEQLRYNDLVILDQEKAFNDLNNALKKYEQLYETVKNERTKYANSYQAMQLSCAELSEKIRIIQKEVEILQNESATKDKAIQVSSIFRIGSFSRLRNIIINSSVLSETLLVGRSTSRPTRSRSKNVSISHRMRSFNMNF